MYTETGKMISVQTELVLLYERVRTNAGNRSSCAQTSPASGGAMLDRATGVRRLVHLQKHLRSRLGLRAALLETVVRELYQLQKVCNVERDN
jgi:hypothetical protein